MTRSDDPLKLLLWIALAVAGVAIATSFVGGLFWGWNGAMGGMMTFGWLWMLLPVVLVVVLVFALSNRQGAPRSAEDALAVAERRYAAGELSREAFQRIQRDIQEGRKP